jgi:hypothetical protein
MFGAVGLCLISTRGMMTAASLAFYEIIMAMTSGRFVLKTIGRTLIPYMPGALAGALFLSWHYASTGWVGFHAGSPWAPAFERPGLSGILRNILVLATRWVDFGRVGEWLVLAILLWQARRAKLSKPSCALLTLAVCVVAFISPTAILYNNLSAHRYFLPGYICLHLLIFHLVAQYDFNTTQRGWLYSLLFIFFAAGNCIVHPRGWSMDWDATLAHLPYHNLRAETITYLDSTGVDYATVGSEFPNLNTGENLMLNGDTRHFVPKDLKTNKLIVASNIFNDFHQDDYRRMVIEQWRPVKTFSYGPVWIEVYARKPALK